MSAERNAVADHDWQPWTEDREGQQLPSAEDWGEILTAIRIGWKTCFLSKAEMVDAINGMSGDAYREWGERLSNADLILRDLRPVVSTALARMIVAGAASTVPDPWTGEEA